MTVLPLVFGDDMPPGKRVKLLRTMKGLRQVDVAQLAETTQAEVSALEQGKYVPPSVVCRIMAALGGEG